MPIDFHAENNRYTYATRSAAQDWMDAIAGLVQVEGKTVLDAGCGGGIYSRAWASLGAEQVIGIDFSEKMAHTAAELSGEAGNLAFVVADAAAAPLADETADIVFERALIHHIADLSAAVWEAHRLLQPGGVYVIQDRTMADVSLPGSVSHIRGFLFEALPRLLEVERQRRPDPVEVEEQLQRAGFNGLQSLVLWETRRSYTGFDELARDLRERTGRSILHELTDDEIEDMIDYIANSVSGQDVIIEKDRWTIWMAHKEVKAVTKRMPVPPSPPSPRSNHPDRSGRR